MYDELIKRLRAQADAERYFVGEDMLYDKAADAIEELQSDNAALSGTVSNLIGQIAELSKPRWIPAIERLPEEGDHVLVYAGFFQPFNEVSYIDAEGKWRFAYDDTEVPIVTHWMPLPQPPKEE